MNTAELLGIDLAKLQTERFDTVEHALLLVEHAERLSAYENRVRMVEVSKLIDYLLTKNLAEGQRLRAYKNCLRNSFRAAKKRKNEKPMDEFTRRQIEIGKKYLEGKNG